MRRHEHLRWYTILLLCVTVPGALISCEARNDEPTDPQSTLQEFYAYDGAEDTLMDPLIVGGASVVPEILQNIKDPQMPKRRYAIGALGNIGDRRAIPSLTKIAMKTDEVDYIRCDCIQAIALIDWQSGQGLARQILDASLSESDESATCLARVSKQILDTNREAWIESIGMYRPLEDARQRRHY